VNGQGDRYNGKTPHRGDMVLFWDQTNCHALCKPYYDTKIATEDGRWGGG
jgi:5-methylcytosine-specific restriction protein A